MNTQTASPVFVPRDRRQLEQVMWRGPFWEKDGKNVFYLEKSMLFVTKMLQNAKRLPTTQKKKLENATDKTVTPCL